MKQVPLSDAVEYIRARGYTETVADKITMNLGKVRKLTLTDINAQLAIREGIAKIKERMGASKVVEEHPMDSDPERSTYKEHPMDSVPERSTYKEHPMDKEEHLGIPEPFNVNRNIKLNRSLDNRIKSRAKELGVSVSSLIRVDLTKIYCE